MTKIGKKAAAAVLALFMAAGLGACGGSAAGGETGQSAAQSAASGSAAAPDTAAGEGIANIAFTDTLGTANPLLMDQSFINLYATGMSFLPLVSFNSSYDVDGMLADSITTEDNQTFTIRLKDNAAWSDGTPVTAEDVIWTILKLSSKAVANANFNFSGFEGFNEDGTSPEGATELDGLKADGDKTVIMKTKAPMALSTFYNTVAAWVCVLPKHKLKDIPDDQLLADPWFNKPDVVSGPYFLDSYDPAHYITYKANDKYFAGAPNIATVNFRIMQGSEILAGLKAGEIDMVHPSAAVPVEDRAEVEKLAGYKAVYADSITNEMTFFNTKHVPDAKVRRAIVTAIDRDTIVQQLLNGKGEVNDGFIFSGSPLYSADKTHIKYDPEQAKQLLAEAGWDGSKTLEYYIPSSDPILTKASQLVQQYLAAVGVQININTVDFATLMQLAGGDDYDMFTVQYTITPNDYWVDENYLVNTPDASWTGGYTNDVIGKALADLPGETDEASRKALYSQIEEQVIADAPLYSLCFMSNLGVVSDRLQGATPSYYGALNNIQTWTLQ